CRDSTQVVSTKWALTDAERNELTKILPRAAKVKQVEIGRNYKGRTVGFPSLPPIAFDESDIKTKVKRIAAAVRALAQKQQDGAALNAAADSFETSALDTTYQEDWASDRPKAAKVLRTALAGAEVDLPDKHEQSLTELEELA